VEQEEEATVEAVPRALEEEEDREEEAAGAEDEFFAPVCFPEAEAEAVGNG